MIPSALQRGGARPQWQLDQGYRKFEDLAAALERNAESQKQVRIGADTAAMTELLL